MFFWFHGKKVEKVEKIEEKKVKKRWEKVEKNWETIEKNGGKVEENWEWEKSLQKIEEKKLEKIEMGKKLDDDNTWQTNKHTPYQHNI